MEGLVVALVVVDVEGFVVVDVVVVDDDSVEVGIGTDPEYSQRSP